MTTLTTFRSIQIADGRAKRSGIGRLRAEALETAREAAAGQDVRIGGGTTMIREFVAAGLVDHMHIVVVPILESLEKDYEVEMTASPSGVMHVTFTRAGV